MNAEKTPYSTLRKSVHRTLIVVSLLATLTVYPKEKNPPLDPPPLPPPPTPSLSQQIKTLEDSGAYPKLDRSTDLKGPDQNLNGVRDDVEAWINVQPITDIQKKAAMQQAEAMQKTLLVDLTDKAALQIVGDALMAGTFCLADMYMPNEEESYKLSEKIKAITFNTKERTMRYIAYNQSRSGSSTKAPKGNPCK
ncbi:MAG TPA: hypothetical protein PK702_08375 [Burkholderiaceae bacterium]|nr:hypothetical protein [Burkholderiaceae bacterium]